MTNQSIRAMAAAVALVASMASLAACNTVAGAGKDVTDVGHATTNAADSAKPSGN